MKKYVRTIELKVAPPSNLLFLFDKITILSTKVSDNPTKEEIEKSIKQLIMKYRKRDEYYHSLKDEYLYLVRTNKRRISPKTQEEKEYKKPYYTPNWFKPIDKEQLEKWGLNNDHKNL